MFVCESVTSAYERWVQENRNFGASSGCIARQGLKREKGKKKFPSRCWLANKEVFVSWLPVEDRVSQHH